jgi:hypothetical protein
MEKTTASAPMAAPAAVLHVSTAGEHCLPIKVTSAPPPPPPANTSEA